MTAARSLPIQDRQSMEAKIARQAKELEIKDKVITRLHRAVAQEQRGRIKAHEKLAALQEKLGVQEEVDHCDGQ